MKNDLGTRTALINYIVFNDPKFSKQELLQLSLTELVIIKTQIELQLQKKEKGSSR
jgi:hypothetical protein